MQTSITRSQQRLDRLVLRYLPWLAHVIYTLIPYSSRRSHVVCRGDVGSGKSAYLALTAYCDLCMGYGIAVLDPNGTLTNYLVQLVINTPEPLRSVLLEKVRLIDMSGLSSHVVPLPIYYQLGPDEAYDQIAARLVNVLIRMDPKLADAPISGKYSTNMVGKLAGVIVHALGLGITEISPLLTDTRSWVDTLRALGNRNPASEIQEAVQFFTQEYLSDWKFSADARTIAFKQRIFDLTFSERRRITYGPTTLGIDLHDVKNYGLCAIFDCSRELDPTQNQFSINWILEYILQFAQYTREEGRDNPLSLIIDEPSAIWFALEHVPELVRIANRDARNNGLLLTVATQSGGVHSDINDIWRETPTTQLVGSLRSHKTALDYAALLHRYSPNMVQAYINEWAQEGSESEGETSGTSSTKTTGETSGTSNTSTSGTSSTHSTGDSYGGSSGGSSTMDYGFGGYGDSSSSFSNSSNSDSYGSQESSSSGSNHSTNRSSASGTNHSTTRSHTKNKHFVIDKRPVYHTAAHQWELTVNTLMLQTGLTFTCKVARFEGDGIGEMRTISLTPHITFMQPEWDKLNYVKQWLIERSGIPREQLLKEINERKGREQFTVPVALPQQRQNTGSPEPPKGIDDYEEIDDEDPLFRKK